MNLSIQTESTCSDPCWYAREDVCRCSCNGRNHGILLAGGPRPTRERRIAGRRYELAAVAVGYGAAHRIAREDYGVWRPGDKGAAVRVAPAAGADFQRLDELAGFEPSPFLQKHPYLIWKAI